MLIAVRDDMYSDTAILRGQKWIQWKEWKIERVYMEIVVIVPLFVLKSFVKTDIVIYDPEGADVDGHSYRYSTLFRVR